MKIIPNFPNYQINKMGDIFSVKSKRRRKLYKDKRGYYGIALFKNGKRYKRNLHDLLLSAYVGPRPRGMHACHGKKGILVNTLDNLRWDTPKNNNKDKYRDGTAQIGERASFAKLKDSDMRKIFSLYPSMFQSQIGKKFRVRQCTIGAILHARAWKHRTLRLLKNNYKRFNSKSRNGSVFYPPSIKEIRLHERMAKKTLSRK